MSNIGPGFMRSDSEILCCDAEDREMRDTVISMYLKSGGTIRVGMILDTTTASFFHYCPKRSYIQFTLRDIKLF